MKDLKKWHEMGNKLTNYLCICHCQRKLKSIVDVLVKIYDKSKTEKPEWTSEEYLIISLLDSIGLITHGVNIEYPIIIDNEFWQWINSIKDDENLEDN